MKRKYYIDGLLLYGWIFGLFSSILVFVIFLLTNDDAYLIMIPFFMIIFLPITTRAFQWVELKDKGIYAKSIFGLIKFCPWNEIDKIEISSTLEGSRIRSQYLIIFSEGNIDETYKLTYNRANLNIRVPYRNETLDIIKKYYTNKIIDLSYQTIVDRRKGI